MKRRTAQSVEPEELHAVEVHLDKLLADRGMTLTELAERANVSVVNLSVLKNGRPCRPLQHLDRDLPGTDVSAR